MNRRNIAVAGVFALVAGVIAGLAMWLAPGSPAPTQPGANTPAAEVVVSTPAETAAPAAVAPAVAPVEVVTSSAAVVKPQPAAAVPKQQAPAAVATDPEVTDPVTTTEPLAPGETYPAPPYSARPSTCATYGSDGTCISYG